MSDIFKKKIKLIDKNIDELNSNTLNDKESLELLKTTTNLLNSASDLILSQNNTISDETNDFLLQNNLEIYYNDLLSRKKIISELTEKYSNIIKERQLSAESESINNSDNESDSLLKKPQIELRFAMNKKQALIEEGQKGLEEIRDNMGEINENLNKQKEDLYELDDDINDNELNAENAGGIINIILSDNKKAKILLSITNVLLFLLIIIVIIYKFFK
jgi:hypothetical protein